MWGNRPPSKYFSTIKKIIFLLPYNHDSSLAETKHEVILFLTCDCGDSSGVFSLIGPWVRVYERQSDRIKVILDWVGKNEIPLEELDRLNLSQ